MGKSYSTSVSTAIDNRLAVTDDAFGLSSSGTGNNTALAGHILNINAGASGSAYKGGGGSTKGGEVNVSILDGGAIGKAFEFAGGSLSKMLDHIITGQKQNQATAQYTADTIGQALQQSAQVNAVAAAASSAAAMEATKAGLTADQEKMQTIKKWLIVGGLAVGGYLLWKGKK